MDNTSTRNPIIAVVAGFALLFAFQPLYGQGALYNFIEACVIVISVFCIVFGLYLVAERSWRVFFLTLVVIAAFLALTYIWR